MVLDMSNYDPYFKSFHQIIWSRWKLYFKLNKNNVSSRHTHDTISNESYSERRLAAQRIKHNLELTRFYQNSF